MAGPPHSVFHCDRAQTSGLPASLVLLADRILRQPDLSSAGRPRQIGGAAPRRQPHHRSTKQDHRHLRSQGHETIPGKLQTEIEDMNLPNPVIRSHYRNGFIKQYVRDHVILRTEPASNNVTDYGVNKAIEHLPALRDKMAAVIDNYLDVQQAILETFVDRGQLRNLTKPTLTPTGKRVPGLKLDNPRQLALMHALVRFAQIPAARTFSTAEIYPHAVAALGSTTEQYSLASLRYDLSKLRVKGLVEKLPRSRRYQLLAEGYSVCLIFLKLFERVYAPLTAARLRPVPGDAALPPPTPSLLDRLYQRFNAALDRLLHAVGLPPTLTSNENKILVHAPINA